MSKGLEGALRLKEIELAQLRLDLWKERHERAGQQVDRWRRELLLRTYESREGGCRFCRDQELIPELHKMDDRCPCCGRRKTDA